MAKLTARRRSRLPLGVLIIALLLVLFGMVTPYRLPSTVNPGNVQFPSATPLPSAVPAPTDVHGGRIVFTCTRNEVNQICSIRADGTGFEQLTEGTAHSYYPAISRDGRDVVFAVNQYDTFDLYRLAPDVVEGPRSTRSRLKRLTDYIGNAFSPSFSPDGNQIAFINRVGERPAALWMVGSNGEDAHEIYAAPHDVVGVAWSPKGSLLAFTVSDGSGFAYDIDLMDVNKPAAPPERVSPQASDIGGSVSWSPDQTHLLFFAGPAAAREIYSLKISTRESSQLTFGGNNAAPCYSPDGQFIVFNSLRNGGQADLYVMRADGHSSRRLTDDPEPDWQPQWGP